MNPELRRLMRLELSPLRLLAAPLLLGLVLIGAGGRRGAQFDWIAIFDLAFQVIALVAAFWGARRAADAVASELRERTWDAQRLSGVGPIQMTIGKLFGAPAGAWYVILLAAAAQITLIALHDGAPARLGPLGVFGLNYETVLAEIVSAFALFAAAAFGAMAALGGQDRARSFDTTLFQALAVLGCLSLGSIFTAAGLFGGEIAYYGAPIDRTIATTIAFAFFGLWAMLGLGHQMRKAFGAHTTAAPWILFLISLAIFVLGWTDSDPTFLLLLSFMTASYGSALIEPHRAAPLRHWARDLVRGRPIALVNGPAWIYAWLGVATCLIVLTPRIIQDTPLIASASPDRARIFFETENAPIAFSLFVLRDMIICLWAGLRARDGRGLWTAALAILALWLIPGAIFNFVGSFDIFSLFLPLNDVSILSAGVQALAALFFARALLTRSRYIGPAGGGSDVGSFRKTG